MFEGVDGREDDACEGAFVVDLRSVMALGSERISAIEVDVARRGCRGTAPRRRVPREPLTALTFDAEIDWLF